MSTISLHKTLNKNFTTLLNSVLRDPTISNAARGLWAQCMSHDHDKWTIYVTQLIKSTREGKTAVYNQLKELIDAGYIIRIQKKAKNEEGKLVFSGIHYIILDEKPKPEELQQIYTDILDKFPHSCFLDTEDVDTENQPLRRLIDKKTNPKKTNKNPLPLSPSPKAEPRKESEPRDTAAREVEDFSSKEKLIENLGLTAGQKKQLLAWKLAELEHAITISKNIKPKQGLMNLLVHILKNPDKYEAPEESLTEQQQLALKHNAELRHNYPAVAEQNDELIRKEHRMEVLWEPYRRPGVDRFVLQKVALTQLALKGPLPSVKADLEASRRVLEEIRRHKGEDKS